MQMPYANDEDRVPAEEDESSDDDGGEEGEGGGGEDEGSGEEEERLTSYSEACSKAASTPDPPNRWPYI